MDDRVTQGGNVQTLYWPNLGLAHYFDKFSNNYIIVMHKVCSFHAKFPIFILKDLSKVICCASLVQITYLVVFEKKMLVLGAFEEGIQGKMLTKISLREDLKEMNLVTLTMPFSLANYL